MQGFYFFVKFGLVLLYIWKVKNPLSQKILFDCSMFNSLLSFFFWKACTFSSFERFLCWKSTNYSHIYLSRIINYWDSILTLFIMWRAFSLVCLLPVFFSFFLFLFFFSFFIGIFLDRQLVLYPFPKMNKK